MAEQTELAAEDGGRRRAGRAGRGGAEARRARRTVKGASPSMPYIQRKIATFDILSEEGLATIEANADRVLQEIGIEFREAPQALERWKAAGADVTGERVRFPIGLVREVLKTAPKSFVQHARNAERSG